MGVTIAVVGIGADGWDGLGAAARAAVLEAEEIVGSARQLALLPPAATAATRTREWPSPMQPLLDELSARREGATCVLASGDPMLHGVGATLARRLEPGRLAVHPQPSAFALACARLGWPAADVELVSAVTCPPEVVARALAPGRRIVAYVTGCGGAAQVARVLRDRGYGPSRLVVLERLGAPEEAITDTTADAWHEHAHPLHAVALHCRPAPGTPLLARIPGLPDEAYEHDGQLSKRHVRALALAALVPLPGQLLWDVGAGAGSVAIEWLRAEPSARAIAVEQHPERADRAAANALRLGVPQLEVVHGRAPAALAALDAPHAVFVGGGVSARGLLDRCWYALRPGGRIVADAVTLEGEQALVAAHGIYGGELTRIEIARIEPLGRYNSWKPQRTVVQWAAHK
jgi:precorrin-6Y C5,15-methyltransferase (decarboxylating)